jgi:hypothetical protein
METEEWRLKTYYFTDGSAADIPIDLDDFVRGASGLSIT